MMCINYNIGKYKICLIQDIVHGCMDAWMYGCMNYGHCRPVLSIGMTENEQHVKIMCCVSIDPRNKRSLTKKNK